MTRARESISKKAYKIAFDYDSKHGSCTQCVLLGISEALGLKMDDVIRAGHPLTGGAALSGYGTCGALSGGLMAVGVLYGRTVEDIKASGSAPISPHRVKSYRLGRQLYDKFVRSYGGSSCRDVQKKIFGRPFDLWSPAEHKEFFDAGGRREKCPGVIGRVAGWVVDMQLRQSAKEHRP